ncbi:MULTISPECIES: hypothetical protein [unclassified Paenibacillus]|uniref:hypothetical protein n=1 Tax=unclassified Paenibacillus TaxID=185978 RepID=UPI0030CACF5B
MGKKESNGVYIGKYGYLNLEDKANAIQSFDKATAGLRKYMMLVPTAASVLEDKWPPYASGGDEMDPCNLI